MTQDRKHLNYCSLFLLALVAIAQGESIWVKYGNQIFDGAGDARAIALSQAEVASATGPLAVLWNPARLKANEEMILTFGHHERLSGNVIFDVIGFNLKDRFRSKWSLVILRQGIQGIPNTSNALLHKSGDYERPLDDSNERILASQVTFFNQVQWAGILGVAASVGEWKLGGSAKLLIHQLGRHTGYGIGFDMGAYRHLLASNTVGLMIRDVTTSWLIWESGTIERIAPEIILGDQQVITIAALNIKLSAMGTLALYLSGKTSSDDFALGSFGGDVRAGMDIQYRDNIHLRLGRNSQTGYSVGVGLAFAFGDLDYAFTPSPLGSVLGNSHYVSLNMKLEFLHSLRERLAG